MTRRINFKWLFIIAVLLSAVSCSRYVVTPTKTRKQNDTKGGMVYALPKTFVKVNVTVEKTDYDASPYVEYAEELLGIVLEADEGALYKIVDVEISAINKADPEAYFYVEPKYSDIAIQLNDKGMLYSINSDAMLPKAENSVDDKTERMSKINLTDLLYESMVYEMEEESFDEEDGNAITGKRRPMSSKDRAQTVAETIMKLRTKKNEILYGEYESDYDSKILMDIYEKLDQQEQEYMQLFVGVKSTYNEVFYVEPDVSKVIVDDQTIELFRFTEDGGIVDSTDTEATIVYCNLRCENEMHTVSRYLKQKPKTQAKTLSKDMKSSKSFRYRVPEIVTVSLITPNVTYQRKIKVAQYGPIMELPYTQFEAIFDQQTGELIYYKNK